MCVDFDSGCALFADLRKKDPFRLTDMDIFSNMLFVMVRDQLASLSANIVCGQKTVSTTLPPYSSFAGADAGADTASPGGGES